MGTSQAQDELSRIQNIPSSNLVGYVKTAEGFTVLHVESDSGKTSLQATPATALPGDFTAKYLIPRPGDQQVHVVVSVLSGTCLAENFYQTNLKPLLDAIGLHEDTGYSLHRTTSAKTISELTRDVFLPRANEGTQQRIILLAGDGGVVDIVNGILSEPRNVSFVAPSVALVPMGTGNALAHSSGITADDTMGLATLARGSSVRLPLLKARFSPGARLLVEEGNKTEELPQTSGDASPFLYGAVVCSWAMHAGLVADSDTTEYRKYGVERFKMAAKEALYPTGGSEPHRYKANISVLRNKDGQAVWEAIDRREHAYVLATLVSNLEKGFNISPHTRPLDGHLRLVHFGPMASDEVMRVMGLAYQQGKHVDEAEVGYEDIEGIRIEFLEDEDRWRRVCVDGKIVLVEKGGWVEARRVVSDGERAMDLVCLR